MGREDGFLMADALVSAFFITLTAVMFYEGTAASRLQLSASGEALRAYGAAEDLLARAAAEDRGADNPAGPVFPPGERTVALPLGGSTLSVRLVKEEVEECPGLMEWRAELVGQREGEGRLLCLGAAFDPF